MVLVWHKKVIPFELEGLYQSKVPGGKKESGWRIMKFGESVKARAVGLCGSYKFQSEKERKQASLLAIEALFTYGTTGNGDDPNLAGMLVSYNGIYDRHDFSDDQRGSDKRHSWTSKIFRWIRMMAIVFVCFLLLIIVNIYQHNDHYQAVKFDKHAIVKKCTNPQVLAQEIYADGGFQGIDYILNTGIVAVRGPVSQRFCFNIIGCLTAVKINCPK